MESNFYPRPPRGGRLNGFANGVMNAIFLSTPSARRATGQNIVSLTLEAAISIHALREEGDGMTKGAALQSFFISIHALREEGDAVVVQQCKGTSISIHALREEGDR